METIRFVLAGLTLYAAVLHAVFTWQSAGFINHVIMRVGVTMFMAAITAFWIIAAVQMRPLTFWHLLALAGIILWDYGMSLVVFKRR